MAIAATGTQTFQQRFEEARRSDFDTPQISQWRCNLVGGTLLLDLVFVCFQYRGGAPPLTEVSSGDDNIPNKRNFQLAAYPYNSLADILCISLADIPSQTGLSQVHNLYFVAYGKSIYIYTPDFPSQKIAEEPSLIFTSQPSSPRLNGYIDQRNPHAINNLVVELFGTEEVIAVVRDDGDVDAFLTRHIVQAIEIRKERGSTIGTEGDEIRPFFQSNVGISAWGLAIHTEARILATSSNAHEVRIFKFGLLQTDDSEVASNENGQGSPHHDTDPTKAHYQRKTDVTYQVLNGETNIPYITFCNTGDDPDARWLLTTDISGVCRVMDLHTLEAVQAFRFGRSFATAHTGGFDRLNAGWAVMFLDRRCFRIERDTYAALGGDEHNERTTPKVYRNGEIWDLSNTARRLDEFSQPFMLHQPQTEEASEGALRALRETLGGLLPGSDSPDSDLGIAVDESMENPESSDDEGADVDIEIDMQNEFLEDENDSGGFEVEITERAAHGQDVDQDDVEYHTAEEDGYDDADQMMLESPNTSESESEPSERIGELFVDDAEDPDDEGTEDTITYASFYNGESIVGNDPRFVHPLAPLCNSIPCPILHASVRNVYLLQPPNNKRPPQMTDTSDFQAASQPPMLGFANPLKQPIHQNFQYLRIYERLNMSTSIPSLGLVILASQKGRAMVLSLTKITQSTHCAPTMKEFDCKDRSIYAMKLEAILPFAEQERQNKRSCYPLHGIAVSPVQGSERSKNGRWRLLMMYQDHSILSYELSRRSKARDSGVDVGAVVV